MVSPSSRARRTPATLNPLIFQVRDTETKRTTMTRAYHIISHQPDEPLPKGEALVCR